MKIYKITVQAWHKYWFEREFVIKASNEATAASRAIKEFWKEKTNKKRKRRVTEMIVTLIM